MEQKDPTLNTQGDKSLLPGLPQNNPIFEVYRTYRDAIDALNNPQPQEREEVNFYNATVLGTAILHAIKDLKSISLFQGAWNIIDRETPAATLCFLLEQGTSLAVASHITNMFRESTEDNPNVALSMVLLQMSDYFSNDTNISDKMIDNKLHTPPATQELLLHAHDSFLKAGELVREVLDGETDELLGSLIAPLDAHRAQKTYTEAPSSSYQQHMLFGQLCMTGKFTPWVLRSIAGLLSTKYGWDQEQLTEDTLPWSFKKYQLFEEHDPAHAIYADFSTHTPEDMDTYASSLKETSSATPVDKKALDQLLRRQDVWKKASQPLSQEVSLEGIGKITVHYTNGMLNIFIFSDNQACMLQINHKKQIFPGFVVEDNPQTLAKLLAYIAPAINDMLNAADNQPTKRRAVPPSLTPAQRRAEKIKAHEEAVTTVAPPAFEQPKQAGIPVVINGTISPEIRTALTDYIRSLSQEQLLGFVTSELHSITLPNGRIVIIDGLENTSNGEKITGIRVRKPHVIE